ncbi:unnamed protein product [Moneuplotes crassus]|uniref:Uncharacterized protein n=1 Tax=Euplotes crassus TaxID=5936 RepID=A0AAD2D3T5_EUPCR|nr:unnamed protein product [Moneuplotes crassus]
MIFGFGHFLVFRLTFLILVLISYSPHLFLFRFVCILGLILIFRLALVLRFILVFCIILEFFNKE